MRTVKLTGNTVGRPIKTHTKVKNIDLAYIAGFLDGDGSVMVQVKKTKFSPMSELVPVTTDFAD